MNFKNKKKPKKTKKDKVAEQIEKSENEIEGNEQSGSIESFNSAVDTSFFYTNDKLLNSIDDAEIIQKILDQYPELIQQNKDSVLKKTFLQFLDDELFIEDLLEYYNLTIYDLFKVIYKQYASLFNTLFIKKVKDKLKNYRYAK